MTAASQTFNLPNEPNFKALVESRNESPKRVLIHDPRLGVDADFDQLLRDVHTTRQSLVNALPGTIFGNHTNIISNNEVVYVPLLTPGNYEFIVAALAVLAIGAALVPLSPAILPEEASYLLQRCDSTFLLASQSLHQRAREIQQYAASQSRQITILPVETGSQEPSPLATVIEEDAHIAPSRPSLIVFTSGTTGPPKGVVHSRRLLLYPRGPPSQHDAISLSHRDPHWIGGLLQFLRPVFGGWRQDIIRADAQVIWERLRQGGLTKMNCVPPLWNRMMAFYQEHIANLPADQREEYLRGLRGLDVARVGTAAAAPSLMRFWRELGKPLMVTYGSTELGGMGLRMTEDTDPGIKNCIGRPGPGVDVQLSAGDEGELLIKRHALFSHYLHDGPATQAAFTDEGFYRTGDEVRRVGKDYVFLGRASSDFIRYYGYKVPILELEHHLRNIPCVAEAYALPVPDAQTGSRVAVLVRFTSYPVNTPTTTKFDLHYLRKHLSDNLAVYKLPTALRTLQDGETIPRTGSEKILRKQTAERFFPVSDNFALPEEVEIWRENNKHAKSEGPGQSRAKAWDWGGIQMGALYGTSTS